MAPCSTKQFRHRDTTRVARVRFEYPNQPDYIADVASIPGHASHEQSLQGQRGFGPLVSSQDQRGLLVPLINRSSTGRCVLPSVYIGFRLFVLLGRRSCDVSTMPWGVRGTFVSWANCFVGVQTCPAPSRRPAVRPDPTCPWYVRVLDSTGCSHVRHYRSHLRDICLQEQHKWRGPCA